MHNGCGSEKCYMLGIIKVSLLNNKFVTLIIFTCIHFFQHLTTVTLALVCMICYVIGVCIQFSLQIT
jgi:hypothetical protein